MQLTFETLSQRGASLLPQRLHLLLQRPQGRDQLPIFLPPLLLLLLFASCRCIRVRPCVPPPQPQTLNLKLDTLLLLSLTLMPCVLSLCGGFVLCFGLLAVREFPGQVGIRSLTFSLNRSSPCASPGSRAQPILCLSLVFVSERTNKRHHHHHPFPFPLARARCRHRS